MNRTCRIFHGRNNARAWFDSSHGVEHLEGRHAGKADFFVRLIIAQAHPGLKPAFTSQVKVKVRKRWRFHRLVKINRHHIANRRAGVTPLLKRFLAAQHQKAAAAFGDELLEEHHLIGCEEFRFEIVDDDSVISIKLFRCLRKTATQFELIARVEPDQNRLIVAFGFLFRFAIKAFEKRITRALFSKGKLWFPLGNTDQSHELDLIIFFQGALHEFVFPVGTARDVKDAVRAFAAVND